MTTLRNSVKLIGRLGNDPELINLGNDKIKVRFSLATSDYYTDKDGERKEDTQWHNIITFGKTAEIAEKFLNKGKEIAISGKLTYRSWEDKDGNTKYITEVVANEIQMLGKK